MSYSAQHLIFKPELKQQKQIIKDMKRFKKRARLEMSFDESGDEIKEEEEVELPEQEEKIAIALQWKRNHYFINCFFVGIFFMIKMEFSYTLTFQNNILMF